MKSTENVEINQLDPKKVELESVKVLENIETINIKAAEMYLNDLLLVDYRKYRSKPSIKTESTIITGTAANLENNQAENVENYEWKTVEIPYIDYISKSISIFSKGNYKKAIQRFEEIKKTYHDDINADFYGALCYYNLGKYEKAVTYFLETKNHKFNNFKQDANWYLAKTYLEMEETKKAKIILKEIIEENEFYSENARKLLEKLVGK